MANTEKLWESFDDILAHREQWNQKYYILGNYNPDAKSIGECGTTQCIAGFRCLRDGLRPLVDKYGIVGAVFVTPDGREALAWHHAQEQFELTDNEAYRLFEFLTDDLADFKHRIEEIIEDKWRDDPDEVAW